MSKRVADATHLINKIKKGAIEDVLKTNEILCRPGVHFTDNQKRLIKKLAL